VAEGEGQVFLKKTAKVGIFCGSEKQTDLRESKIPGFCSFF
jgi:hypothetical protein